MFLTLLIFSNLTSSHVNGIVAITINAAKRYNFIQLQSRPWRANARASPTCRKKYECVNADSKFSVYNPVRRAGKTDKHLQLTTVTVKSTYESYTH